MSLRGKLGLLLLCVCTSTGASGTRALPVQQLAPGLFFHQGVHEEMTPANAGAIANIGFILGRRCVAVIDTGGSLENGQRHWHIQGRVAVAQGLAYGVRA